MGKYIKKPKLTTTTTPSSEITKSPRRLQTPDPTPYWASGSIGPARDDLWAQTETRSYLDCESMERENTRSFNMDAETTVALSSSTRGLLSFSAPYQRQQNLVPTNIPSKHEIDEFFALAELQQELLFIERYNFDVKNDVPLTGRYEWVKVDQ